MLETTITTDMWEQTFQSKFSQFCKRAPVMLKMSIRIQDGFKGVLVTHVNSNLKYFFPFNYDENVKDFIAHIKKLLVSKHYPRLVYEVYENHQKTNEEIVSELESGKDIDNLEQYCMKLIGTRVYVIDKILSWKELALLRLEESNIPGDEIGSVFRYSFQKSLVLYLRDYRTGKFGSIENASAEFFNNSLLIDEIKKKKEEEEDE